jgi:hypothetical protein
VSLFPSVASLLNLEILHRLKRDYSSYRKELCETGQGLLDEDQEDEIIEGTEIDNIWSMSFPAPIVIPQGLPPFSEKIQAKFPWYKDMHALMGTSPVVDKSAIANSATMLDTTVLTRDGAVCR